MTKSYYNSAALGNIELSLTGRRHMQNMREETVEMVSKIVEANKGLPKDVLIFYPKDHWTALSHARGRTAQYISSLEARIRELEAEAHIGNQFASEIGPLPVDFTGMIKLHNYAKELLKQIQSYQTDIFILRNRVSTLEGIIKKASQDLLGEI